MTTSDIVAAINAGCAPDHSALATLPDSQREEAIRELLGSQAGRRWLRSNPTLDLHLANTLLGFEDDFRQHRRDGSLAATVAHADRAALREHAAAIAAGPAGYALWRHMAHNREWLVETALSLVTSADAEAAEATLYHLVLDPLDQFSLGHDVRGRIASGALSSPSARVRGTAAEFLAADLPAELLSAFDELVNDPDERVRGIVWTCALQLARADARDLAISTISDESTPVPIRRSALIAAGTHLPTADLIDLLSILVVHPIEELALDAAMLLHDHHRHPAIATAAQNSPHAEVRRIADDLLDPFRGSPAAGGSRPGDPTRADATEIFADMLRQIEERAERPNGKTDAIRPENERP
jgi:hypothetical protein